MILIKIHRSYRNVVAICDSDLIGKEFESGKLYLDVKVSFFQGQEYKESEKEQALKVLQSQLAKDATFSIIGKESINLAIEAGVIGSGNVSHVQGIPFALKLL